MKSLLIVTILTLSPFVASSNVSPVRVISTKSNMFYFRVDRSFVGAVIEVLDAEGKLVLADTVAHHKAIIDFYYENPGVYSIKMKKDDRVWTFTFEKTDSYPVMVIQQSHEEGSVSIIQ